MGLISDGNVLKHLLLLLPGSTSDDAAVAEVPVCFGFSKLTIVIVRDLCVFKAILVYFAKVVGRDFWCDS